MGLFDASYSDVMAGTPRLSGRGAVPARSFGQLLSLLGEPLPGSDEMQTSAMYRAGLLDAMAGGPTQGEFREGMRNKMANTALGLLGAIEPLYHGSPHKFSRFDLSKIGSGEGAQAYGHGAYLAESPRIAGYYRDALAKTTRAHNTFDGKKITPSYIRQLEESPDKDVANFFKFELPPKFHGTSKKAVEWIDNKRKWAQEQLDTYTRRARELRENPPAMSTYTAEQFDEFAKNQTKYLDYLNAMRSRFDAVPEQKNAYLYEARLRWPDAAREASDPLGPQHVLDWDKPLSEQAPDVQRMLNGLGIDNAKNGEDLLWKLKRSKFDVRESMPGSTSGANQWATEQLRSVGIPGIRYLDAGSRGAGAGTHNYVVFDDQLIELLKRNGEAIGGLLGGK